MNCDALFDLSTERGKAQQPASMWPPYRPLPPVVTCPDLVRRLSRSHAVTLCSSCDCDAFHSRRFAFALHLNLFTNGQKGCNDGPTESLFRLCCGWCACRKVSTAMDLPYVFVLRLFLGSSLNSTMMWSPRRPKSMTSIFVHYQKTELITWYLLASGHYALERRAFLRCQTARCTIRIVLFTVRSQTS